MKRIFELLALLLTSTIFSQNVHIPDSNFKNYLLTNTEVNTNNDSHIQMSEASSFTGSLAFQFWQIDDLTGIEAFTNLTFLDCGDNNLTTLDLSQNVALQQLYCYDNQLTSLNLSANVNLFALDCRNNLLTSLDMSSNPLLYYLNCPFNNLESINVSNTAMQTLRCYSNNLTSLNLTNTNTSLQTLLVYNNYLTELDLSNFAALQIFECGNSTSLVDLNIANGNNTNITTYNSLNTPNLECIEVDDETYATNNWSNKDALSTFSEDCSLSILEHELIVKYYPNPTKNYLYIDVLEEIELSIISLKGLIVKSRKLFKGSNKLTVVNLSEGIYILHAKTLNGKAISTRFVKN